MGQSCIVLNQILHLVKRRLLQISTTSAASMVMITRCMCSESYNNHLQIFTQLLLSLLPDQQILQKKGKGRIIHVSGFINAEDGRLALRDEQGNIVEEAREIIYPGANGDAWWNTEQLLNQIKRAIRIFESTHPDCIALFIFDQSSAHASLPADALKAFEMNKSNGGKQRKQWDTVIPDTNPTIEHCGKPQKMCLLDGQPKGLQQVLEECGFDVRRLQVKCSPVCPWENEDCCMARLLSKQDDFVNQLSMLETLIKDAGHECMFLPKFHCELNPIEMVCSVLHSVLF
jgi:hypothetical protein